MRKATPSKKATRSGDQPTLPKPPRLLDGGVEQGPDTRSDHHAGREPEENAVRNRAVLAKKEHHAEPAVVMSHVKPHPIAAHASACIRFASNCIRFEPFLVWILNLVVKIT